jgi:hypothetical protein
VQLAHRRLSRGRGPPAATASRERRRPAPRPRACVACFLPCVGLAGTWSTPRVWSFHHAGRRRGARLVLVVLYTVLGRQVQERPYRCVSRLRTVCVAPNFLRLRRGFAVRAYCQLQPQQCHVFVRCLALFLSFFFILNRVAMDFASWPESRHLSFLLSSSLFNVFLLVFRDLSNNKTL